MLLDGLLIGIVAGLGNLGLNSVDPLCSIGIFISALVDDYKIAILPDAY